jgi:lipopolysaccharide/colanic/teichoic acid biosynthesis glycosyltransferase
MNQTMTSGRQVLSRRWEYYRVKRLLELALCLLLLPIAVPVLALFSLLIVLDSPGPSMLVETRVGKRGRRFRMYKLRTMAWRVDDIVDRAWMRALVNVETGQVESERVVFKPFRESQVTRVGRILHRTSLDELPQLINVLKGEMSLIGPRPSVPWQVDAYKDWHRERLKVSPGITGLAQVNGRTCISFDRIVKYDLEYIESQSLRMDLMILWLTVRSVIRADGAH